MFRLVYCSSSKWFIQKFDLFLIFFFLEKHALSRIVRKKGMKNCFVCVLDDQFSFELKIRCFRVVGC